MKNLLLTLITVFTLSFNLFAQDAMGDLLKAYSKEQFKYNELEQKYDKFKDKTSYSLRLLVKGDPIPFEGISILTNIEFDGKVFPTTKKEFSLLFINIEKKTRLHTTAPSLIFLVDNQRIKLENKLYVPDKDKPTLIEMAFYSLTLDNLKTFANAKVIEGQLGELEFTFTERQRQLLKEFYDKLTAK
jgi:hypothetical protein